MVYCSKCGAPMADGVQFCENCGAPVEAQPAQQPQAAAEPNKAMGVLCYLSFLCLIPFFAEKNDQFVVYHAKQGMNLLIIEVIVGIVAAILSVLFLSFSFTLYSIWSVLSWLMTVGFTVLSIIGIINVCKPETKPLPIVGGIKIIK
ncbi:MAG: zinc ribbon domain-containing protein [Clostridia bacterium]|nr:zinc ribbon domain-containing protein [Clostridia bacterium]